MNNIENFNLEEKIANVLFEVGAVKININKPFTFASGIKSPIYCDNRYILGFPKHREMIVEGLIKGIEKDTEVIAGVATAGIPWASFVADRMGIPLSYVRNKPKEHGRGRQVEGAEIKGKKIVLIEDLITTGNSSLIAVDVLQKEGAGELEVKSIFSYGFKKAEESYEKYKCKFSSLSSFTVLIGTLKKNGYITEKEAETALEWKSNPEEWGK